MGRNFIEGGIGELTFMIYISVCDSSAVLTITEWYPLSITLDKSKIEISKFTTFEGGRKRRMKKKM